MQRKIITCVALVALAAALAAPATAQVDSEVWFGTLFRTVDLLSLRQSGGAAAPGEGRYELTLKAVFGSENVGPRDIVAFEENPRFTFAAGLLGWKRPAASTPPAPAQPPELARRLLLLKPAIVVLDDEVLRSPTGWRFHWCFWLANRARIEGPTFRIDEDSGALVAETLLPAEAQPSSHDEIAESRTARHAVHIVSKNGVARERFVHVIQLCGKGEEPRRLRSAALAKEGGLVELSVDTGEQTLRLTLPRWDAGAGAIAIESADGTKLLESRPLASGILPHTPEGMKLLEQWDSAYRGGTRPGWDTGRPSSELVKAVASGKIKPCRTLELGCGLGTNAIHLAGCKFNVSALDISPSALSGAMERAEKANVNVNWVLADVLAPPKIGPFDFIYDRGCYHGVRRGNAAGYVETLRKLTRPGGLVLIEAGNANEARQYGPPRVKEEELRADFSPDFDFVELREAHFDTSDPKAQGALSWFILLRRKEKS